MNLISSKRAKDLMSTPTQTIEKSATLRQAAKMMDQAGCHCLIINPDDELTVLGVITSKDIVQILADEDVAVLDELLVADYMTSPLVTVQGDMPLDRCIALMRMTGTRRVPVMEGSQMIGLLSFSDILKLVAA